MLEHPIFHLMLLPKSAVKDFAPTEDLGGGELYFHWKSIFTYLWVAQHYPPKWHKMGSGNRTSLGLEKAGLPTIDGRNTSSLMSWNSYLGMLINYVQYFTVKTKLSQIGPKRKFMNPVSRKIYVNYWKRWCRVAESNRRHTDFQSELSNLPNTNNY